MLALRDGTKSRGSRDKALAAVAVTGTPWLLVAAIIVAVIAAGLHFR